MPAVTLYTDKAHLARVRALRDVPTTVMDESIEDMSRLMDGYFRARFKLPFVKVGGDVGVQCVALVTYDLLVNRGFNPAAGGGDTAIETRYLAAVQWLRDITNTKVTPDVQDSSGTAEEGQPSMSADLVSSPSRGWSTRGLAPNGTGEPGGFVGGDPVP